MITADADAASLILIAGDGDAPMMVVNGMVWYGRWDRKCEARVLPCHICCYATKEHFLKRKKLVGSVLLITRVT